MANHRNVVQFYGFSGAGIVTELMEGGDLRRALDGLQQADFAWELRGKRVALDIARGLLFLHSSKVIHRCLALLLHPFGAGYIPGAHPRDLLTSHSSVL